MLTGCSKLELSTGVVNRMAGGVFVRWMLSVMLFPVLLLNTLHHHLVLRVGNYTLKVTKLLLFPPNCHHSLHQSQRQPD